VLVTHNRSKFLCLALKSIMQQTLLPDEIIIIDDASKTPVLKEIVDIIELCKALDIRIKIFRTKNEVGLGAARSIGARRASGKYIVFIDDDAIASKQLIESYINMFKKKRCKIIAGPCYPLYLSEYKLPNWWDEQVLGGLIAVRNDLTYMSKRTWNPADYVFGCNFAIDKNVLESLRGFKPWLGRVRGMLLSGEEWDFVSRALSKGFKVCFSGSAFIYHIIPPSKITIKRMMRMCVDMGRTRCILAHERVFNKSLSIYFIYCAIAVFKDLIEAVINMLMLNEPKTMKKIYDSALHLNTILLCKDTIHKLRSIK